MARKKQPPKDLTGIRQRGGTYQVRVFAGYDPVTGRQLMLSGSADTEEAAIVIRDQLRQQMRDNTAARTNVTLGYLVDEWLSGHQVEGTTRDSYRLLINGFSVRRSALLPWPSCASRDCAALRAAAGLPSPLPRPYFYRAPHTPTARPHDCDERCSEHVCKPLAVTSIRQCTRCSAAR